MPTANEDILDASIRHQIGLQRLSAGIVKRIIALLDGVDGDLVKQLLKYDPTAVGKSFSQKRLEKLLEAVRVINKEAYAVLSKELDAELRALAVYEADYQRKLIETAVMVKLDIVTPSAPQLVAAVKARPFQGRHLKDWYAGLAESAQRRIVEAIQIGFVEGEPIDKMVRRIRGTRALRYKDGILEINRRSAEMVVRTAVNHTANAARAEMYRENAGVIKGVRWVSTLDGRTSAVCRSRDGEVYPVDSGPRPPAHPNCRSTTAPVLKSWKELGISLAEAPEGTRASMNGQVPASETYDIWLRKQDSGFQDDVLGVTKGRLFRKGDLSLDRFVDQKGHEYTLEELRRREAAAFARAGL